MADGVIGNDPAINQIRCGRHPEDGEQRGNVGKLLGDVPSAKFDK
jgi:acetolactate synthase-1/2/3 large subunit